jgi:O-6-methylguanine DNA methyltransferase
MLVNFKSLPSPIKAYEVRLPYPGIAYYCDDYLIGYFLNKKFVPKKFQHVPISNDTTIAIKEPKLALFDVTDFYADIYRALLNIPMGFVKSYSDLARDVNHPGASRAVGTAVSRNNIAIFIPCHRVVPKCGGIGQYLYGSDLKRVLLMAECVDLHK